MSRSTPWPLLISVLLVLSCGRPVDQAALAVRPVQSVATPVSTGLIVYKAPAGHDDRLSKDGSIPTGVDHLRFRGLDNGGVPVYGPVTLAKSTELTLEAVPTVVTRLVVELVEQQQIRAATSLPVRLEANQSVTLKSPHTFVLAPPGSVADDSAEPSHGYFYHLASIARATVKAGADIGLSSNGPAQGVSHRAGQSEILVENPGTYLVEYQAALHGGIGASLALAVNGEVDPATIVLRRDSFGLVSGRAILKLASGDSLTLRNNAMDPITLALDSRVGVRISLMQLGVSPTDHGRMVTSR
jgi:hypothetical protein